MVSIFSTVRDIERLRQIVMVLGRHGFGEIVQRTGMGRVVRVSEPPPPSTPSTSEDDAGVSVGARVRMVLEDLGPSFIKLGQILSTRPDLIPAHVIAELKLLQESAQPLEFDELRAQVERELGTELKEVFTDLEENPLASASIAQVHRATLRPTEDEGTSREVVIKIQRPNIKNVVDRDIELLFILARAIERSIPEARIYNPVGLVEEFSRAMSSELNFNEEAAHADRFLSTFSDSTIARFPRVYRDASARKVLTLEFLPGKKLQTAIDEGYSGEAIAKTVLEILLKQIFEDGFFHADPHPGNLLILGEKDAPVIGMIDLGLVGRLSPELRDKTIDLMVAAARKDARAVADALYAIGRPTKRIDRREYTSHVTSLAERYLGKPLKEIEVSLLIRDIVQGAMKFGLEIPPEFLMLARTLMTVEGVGKEIYPDLDVLSETRPYFVKLLKMRYSPERMGNEALRVVQKLSDRAGDLPDKVDDLLEELLRGHLTVRTQDPELPMATDLLGRRIFSGMTIAALITGGSLLIATRGEITGYVMLSFSGLWLFTHAVKTRWVRRKKR